MSGNLEDECIPFTTLVNDLHAAKINYAAMEREESAARSRATGALNHLNELQKKFDAVVAEMRKKASCNSEWGRERNKPLNYQAGPTSIDIR